MNKKLFLVLLVILAFVSISLTHKSAPSKFSSVEFTRTALKFTQIVDEQGPGVALQQMRTLIKTDNRLAAACHDLLHEVGHAAFNKYGDFAKAMSYRDELCNSGYIHGVLESYFSHTPDVSTLMQTVCASYPSGKFMSWECFHGVGHALMFYTSNDLPKSLQLCSSYSSAFAASSCINGVFMENFTTEQIEHHTKYLNSDDLFYPCDIEPTPYKNDCYLYTPIQYLTIHPSGYFKALIWCETAIYPYNAACIQGVGMQAMKDNINNPKLVENICGSSPNAKFCIAGMINLLINHYGSLEPAQLLCHQLKIPNQAACQLSLQSSASLFPNPAP